MIGGRDLSATSASVRSDTVEQQLDTINVLAEAFAAAIRSGAREKESELRASLERFLCAFGWNVEACVPAVLRYANARTDGDEDLFAPAFILMATAPERPDLSKLMARLSQDARELIARIHPKMSPLR